MFNKLRKSISPKPEKFHEVDILPSRSGFNGLGITENIIKVIAGFRFAKPTPVQKQAIPIGIEGRDLIGVAQTGTGKTLAFGIPMIMRLSESKSGRGLIVLPTRELALQVDASIQAICRVHQMRSTVIIGGVPIEPQCRALARQPDIIIATPGRLIDHLDRHTIDLSDIKILVLDEADRMLDMGFAPAISRIISFLPKKRQTMLFSATMPDEIITLARKYMDNPAYVEVTRSGSSPDEITHEIFFVDNADKTRLLEIQLHKRTGPVLVFTRTKHGAKKLTMRIRDMGHSVAEIHSNRSLEQRSSALEGFKSGKHRVLVATDIAARGIDVTGIMMVINYDLPSTSEGYVHRIGRTGRSGANGHAISFATFDQEKEIINIENFIGAALPVSALPFPPSGRFHLSQERTSRRGHSQTRQKPLETRSSPQPSIQSRAFGRQRVKKK